MAVITQARILVQAVVSPVAHTPLHIAQRWMSNVRTTSPARDSCVMGTGEQSRVRFINSVVIRFFV